MQILQAGLAETKKLQLISRQTFFETFEDQNSAENMRKYLDENLSVENLAQQLRNPDSEFYFALIDKRVVGYLKVNFRKAQTEMHEKNSMEIERIYVLKEFQGKGVGQALYQKALEVAKRQHSEYIWLGVWEKNLLAINFYKKNGLVEFDKHIFKLGNDEQTDILMRLDIPNSTLR